MSAVHPELDDLLALRPLAASVDLSSRRRVLTDLAGTHLSGFRGRGMDFDEHRVYQPGDDVRTIDWRVTARTGQPHVRLYREERERPVFIVTDLRRGMRFGTRNCFKSVLAARAAAVVAWSAMGNGDRVGGQIMGLPRADLTPRGGRRGAMRMLHGLTATDTPTDESPNDALQRVVRTARPGSLIFILSDWHGANSRSGDLVRQLGRHCELVIGFISDPLDGEAPPPGRYPYISAGDDSRHVLDTSAGRTRQQWQIRYKAHRQMVANWARDTRAHWLDLSTAQSLADSLRLAFGTRRSGRP